MSYMKNSPLTLKYHFCTTMSVKLRTKKPPQGFDTHVTFRIHKKIKLICFERNIDISEVCRQALVKEIKKAG